MVWIAQVDHPNTGVEVRKPRDLVSKAIQLSAEGFGGLVRTKAPAFVAKVTHRYLPDRDRKRLRLGGDVEHVGSGSHSVRARFHIRGSAGLVDDEGVRARQGA